jgi:hypothetical protein
VRGGTAPRRAPHFDLNTGVARDIPAVRNATILCAIERRPGKTVPVPPPIARLVLAPLSRGRCRIK